YGKGNEETRQEGRCEEAGCEEDRCEEDLEEEVRPSSGIGQRGTSDRPPLFLSARYRNRHLMQRLRLDPHRTPSPTALAPLLRHLDAGGVIAIPTDTIYGLAANACDAAAVA